MKNMGISGMWDYELKTGQYFKEVYI